MKRFSVEILAKNQADSFFVCLENTYGKQYNILIDGGCEGLYSDSQLAVRERISKLNKLDYIMVTHVDNDHIGGIISLLSNTGGKLDISKQVKDTVIIFNTLNPKGLISYAQGKKLEDIIRKRKNIVSYKSRYRNNGDSLMFLSKNQRLKLYIDANKRETVYITFLNPDINGVSKVYKDYSLYTKGQKKSVDSQLINKNSIAIIIEFLDIKVLFTGDCYFQDISDVISKINNSNSRCPIGHIDCIKVPHHGASKYNQGLVALSKETGCKKFIVTGNSKWDKVHPHEDLISDLSLISGCEIYTFVDLKSSDEPVDLNPIEFV